jgi:hypothetical protein
MKPAADQGSAGPPTPLRPGETAPAAGYYRAHDAAGSPIEQVVAMREGEQLPPLPAGFTWAKMMAW